jgi:hypothetical protein
MGFSMDDPWGRSQEEIDQSAAQWLTFDQEHESREHELHRQAKLAAQRSLREVSERERQMAGSPSIRG